MESVSVWKNGIRRVEFPRQEGDRSTDVLIIGGGLAGVLCAYKLQSAGVDCLLVEAKEIGSGITGNTTAKVTLAHGLIYDKLIRRFGADRARRYLTAEREAEKEYARLCAGLDCDYEVRDSYVYTMDDRRSVEREIAALRRLGAVVEPSDAAELPFRVAAAMRLPDGAQLHPLKFLYGIAQGLPILEDTKVREFLPHRVKTDRGEIAYKTLIVATHFPIFNKHGLYPLKLYQHRSYVLALRGAPPVRGMYVDASDRGLSFRSYGDLLLLGGGGHRTGKSGGGWQELEEFAEAHYPSATAVGRWATQDCMTLDGVPYIGRYARGTPDVYVATGFNKWGMTNAMVAATLLADLVKGVPTPNADVISPTRSVHRPQLAVNLWESLLGILTPTVPRCPHLGCALKYNPEEHSWDCPCHGSRFTDDGEVIDNPATDDKKTKCPRRDNC